MHDYNNSTPRTNSTNKPLLPTSLSREVTAQADPSAGVLRPKQDEPGTERGSALPEIDSPDWSWTPQPTLKFIGSLVADHGYRVAILIRQIHDACVCKLHRRTVARVGQTVEALSAAQDISTRQFRRIAEAAVNTGLVRVEYENRCGMPHLVFTCDRRLPKLVADEAIAMGRSEPFSFNARLARHVSIDAALIYPLIQKASAEGVRRAMESATTGHCYVYNGVYVRANRIQLHYPWMNRFAILYSLRLLVESGLVVRTESRHTGWQGSHHFVYKVAENVAFLGLNEVAAILDARSAPPAAKP